MPAVKLKLFKANEEFLTWLEELGLFSMKGIRSRVAGANGFLPMDLEIELAEVLRLDSGLLEILKQLEKEEKKSLSKKALGVLRCGNECLLGSEECLLFDLCDRDLVITTGKNRISWASIVDNRTVRFLIGLVERDYVVSKAQRNWLVQALCMKVDGEIDGEYVNFVRQELEQNKNMVDLGLHKSITEWFQRKIGKRYLKLIARDRVVDNRVTSDIKSETLKGLLYLQLIRTDDKGDIVLSEMANDPVIRAWLF